MGKLVYMLNVSLDGFVEGPNHDLSWSAVDEQLHTWFGDQERQFDAALYGRGMYETMAGAWPDIAADPSTTGYMRDYADAWMASRRYVFSSTLESVEHNSTLVRGDVREELARIRQEHGGDLNVGGATLAASFIRAGLVDEYRLVIHPVAIGRGTPYFPALDEPLRLTLIDSHRFDHGVQLLAYRPAT